MIDANNDHRGRSEDVNRIMTPLLNILATYSSYSLEHLSKKLNVSQQNVLNCIEKMQGLGLNILNQNDQGFTLAQNVNFLNKDTILKNVTSNYNAQLTVENIVTSTNDVIKEDLGNLPQGSACIAEAQTQGRGRRGKKWVSPFGASIYFSMIWRFAKGYQSVEGLSLLIGLAVNQALKDVGIKDCQLKWPNDVYHDNKKLAGILIEVEGQSMDMIAAVIGIGVNFRLPKSISNIDQPFTDIATIMSADVDRNVFVAHLLNHIWSMIPIFNLHGLKPFIQLWQTSDLFHNKPVTLLLGKDTVHGIYRGINECGALLLQTDTGIDTYHGGEISVRPS